jgi:hypothetical protein
MEKLIIAVPGKNFAVFFGVSLQESTTGPCPVPVESSPCPLTPLLFVRPF